MSSSPSNLPVAKPETQRPDAGHMPMSEELDSAQWNLPPIMPVVIAAAVLAVIITTYLLASRKPPTSTGTAVRVVALPLHIESKGSIAPGQMGTVDQNVETHDMVMVNIELDVKNAIQKPMYLKNVQAKLVTAKGEFSDDAAPASDYDRILQAYPQLAIAGGKPLQSESSIPAGADQQGLAVFSFPVTRDVWDQRTSLQAQVNFYDHAPLVMDLTKLAAAQDATLPTKVTK
ncbi:MAG: hypothetical protein JOZ10_17590 [Acidobacteria bacterium]|nr:hypothetical protein [Acidobacteriota bacterium]MBV9147667.1 hypothetical protein [Acidobacteriota bacterium]